MAKLRLATIHLEDAQPERIWAMMTAHKANAANQQTIAAGVSPHRVHQLRTTDAAQDIPVWLGQLPEHHPLLSSGGSRGLTLVSQLGSEPLLLVVKQILVLPHTWVGTLGSFGGAFHAT
jgi:hypothetical protein